MLCCYLVFTFIIFEPITFLNQTILEHKVNDFNKDTHIVKCLKCGKINKWKGSTLYNEKFSCNHLTEKQIQQRRLENEINNTILELRKEIKMALDEAGIEIPYPKTEIINKDK